MAGVVDKAGVQWERCNGCGKATRLDDLGYQKPCKEFRHGRDLCVSCFNGLDDAAFTSGVPATTWVGVAA